MLARCYTATVSPSLPQPVIIAYHLSERRGGKRAGGPNGMEVGTVIYSAGNKYTRFCYEVVLYPPLSLSRFLSHLFERSFRQRSRVQFEEGIGMAWKKWWGYCIVCSSLDGQDRWRARLDRRLSSQLILLPSIGLYKTPFLLSYSIKKVRISIVRIRIERVIIPLRW